MPYNSKSIPGGHPAGRIDPRPLHKRRRRWDKRPKPWAFSNIHHFKIVFEFKHGYLYEHLYVCPARVNRNCVLVSSNCSANVTPQQYLFLMAGTATD
jgi:hypothetical protein